MPPGPLIAPPLLVPPPAGGATGAVGAELVGVGVGGAAGVFPADAFAAPPKPAAMLTAAAPPSTAAALLITFFFMSVTYPAGVIRHDRIQLRS
jgi:hypothetical protein